jgi:hypothetical protein
MMNSNRCSIMGRGDAAAIAWRGGTWQELSGEVRMRERGGAQRGGRIERRAVRQSRGRAMGLACTRVATGSGELRDRSDLESSGTWSQRRKLHVIDAVKEVVEQGAGGRTMGVSWLLL